MFFLPWTRKHFSAIQKSDYFFIGKEKVGILPYLSNFFMQLFYANNIRSITMINQHSMPKANMIKIIYDMIKINIISWFGGYCRKLLTWQEQWDRVQSICFWHRPGNQDISLSLRTRSLHSFSREVKWIMQKICITECQDDGLSEEQKRRSVSIITSRKRT